MLHDLRTRLGRAARRRFGLSLEPIIVEVTYEDILADLTYPQPPSTAS